MEGPLPLSIPGHLALSATALERLLMACALGGAVGLEREWRHKDSGLRTNMLICMGAALFTIMSAALAGETTADKSRVASNIVQGIGFIGAGLILHTKNRIVGLTSAATVFVVAAIGMTCGAGLYLEALFATVLLLLALQAVGGLERRLDRKRYPMLYEVRTDAGRAAPQRALTAILAVLDEAHLRFQLVSRDELAGMERITFSLIATRGTHKRILAGLRAAGAGQVFAFRDREDE